MLKIMIHDLYFQKLEFRIQRKMEALIFKMLQNTIILNQY